jgi:hypothetical protein
MLSTKLKQHHADVNKDTPIEKCLSSSFTKLTQNFESALYDVAAKYPGTSARLNGEEVFLRFSECPTDGIDLTAFNTRVITKLHEKYPDISIKRHSECVAIDAYQLAGTFDTYHKYRQVIWFVVKWARS